MNRSKLVMGTIIVWGLVNLGLYTVIESNEDETESEFILAPDLIRKFDALHVQTLSAQSNDASKLKARLLKPEKIDEGKSYPLIVSLHGAGERGNDNQQQLKYLPLQMTESPWKEKYPCFLLAPQCPREMYWSSPALSADFPENKNRILLDHVHQMVLDVSRNYPVDQQRIYITGYSMGGFGTWSMIARYPETFAAAVPICGGGKTETVSHFLQMPIWVVHGDADQIIPVTASREMVDALHKAGGSPIYKELHGVNHNSWTPAYQDQSGMLTWLFKQRKTVQDSH